MTPRDHMSQDLSYFSGPRTSGAATVWREIIQIEGFTSVNIKSVNKKQMTAKKTGP